MLKGKSKDGFAKFIIFWKANAFIHSLIFSVLKFISLLIFKFTIKLKDNLVRNILIFLLYIYIYCNIEVSSIGLSTNKPIESVMRLFLVWFLAKTSLTFFTLILVQIWQGTKRWSVRYISHLPYHVFVRLKIFKWFEFDFNDYKVYKP